MLRERWLMDHVDRPSHPQGALAADPVIVLPGTKPLESRTRGQHVEVGVSPTYDLHPDRKTV